MTVAETERPSDDTCKHCGEPVTYDYTQDRLTHLVPDTTDDHLECRS
jgi:hypothetical protein